MSENCIFCKIANKEICSNIVLENDDIIAFHDLSPQAPVHILVIPKKHFSSLNQLNDDVIIAKLLYGVKEVAKKLDIEEGYRLVVNTGESAGQSVGHVHFHVLGGRQMKWPPG